MRCDRPFTSRRPGLEVADIVRRHRNDYIRTRGPLARTPHYVLDCLERCRTAQLGGHRRSCDTCGLVEQAYNGCRNRHCKKCQALARAAWLEARSQELLPVEYFHVVFTLPESIASLARQNPEAIYHLLFTAAQETLQEIAAEPRYLGARIGILAVLHTWGQRLDFHPHLHCVIPGGGLSADRSRWVACRRGFFLPVRVLSSKFRGKFLAKLKQLHQRGKLKFTGRLRPLRKESAFQVLLDEAYKIDWVVYCKPPFGGPAQVLKYLARYTHRVAISNQRLLALENGQVTFRYKDYAKGNRLRTMMLPAVEFLRRFLMHVLPKGFVRIRQFGFLANCHRAKHLKQIRELLSAEEVPAPSDTPGDHSTTESVCSLDAAINPFLCPHCGSRLQFLVLLPVTLSPFDTS